RETTCRVPTSSCARPRFSLLSSPLPLSAARTILLLSLFVPGHRSTATALRQDLKAQRSGNRRSFDQLDRHRIAKTVGFARAGTNHRVAFLVIAEIFVAYGSRRHEAVGTRVAQFHEQPSPGDARNASVEICADTIGEEMSDQTIGRLALG